MVKLYFRKKGKRENDILIEKNLRIAGNIFVVFFSSFFSKKEHRSMKGGVAKIREGFSSLWNPNIICTHYFIWRESNEIYCIRWVTFTKIKIFILWVTRLKHNHIHLFKLYRKKASFSRFGFISSTNKILNILQNWEFVQ